MVTQTSFPGWGHMLQSGATTLWETWQYSDNVYSHNHPMFGSVGEWMYQSLGGINSIAPGFSEIVIKPQPTEGLDWVNCCYQSVNGKITSNWKAENGTFTLHVRIPVNSKAIVYIPAPRTASVKEGGKTINEAEGIRPLGYENGYHRFTVGSGNYSFTAGK